MSESTTTRPSFSSRTVRWLIAGAVALILTMILVSSNNTLAALSQQTQASSAEVLNQYKRRADLVPNLVETVRGYAGHENQTLREVTEARARATQVTLDAGSLTDPEKMRQFQDAQMQLAAALGKLLMLREAYPTLKADRHFSDLQKQLEGTENRIAVARRDQIAATQAYNTVLLSIPIGPIGRLIGYLPAPAFTIDDADKATPRVTFGGSAR